MFTGILKFGYADLDLTTKKLFTMNMKYKGRLICATCGHDSYLESNHDESYILCMFCQREYEGGYDELFQLNAEIMGSLRIDADTAIFSQET